MLLDDRPEVFGLSFGAHYNFYNTGDLPVAWHKPRLQLLLAGWYNLYDKVRLGAELYAYSGIDGMDTAIDTDYYTESGKTRLEAIADLNFRAEYHFSQRYKAFVNINNVFGKNYQYFLQYPNRGLQAMIGFSIDF